MGRDETQTAGLAAELGTPAVAGPAGAPGRSRGLGQQTRCRIARRRASNRPGHSKIPTPARIPTTRLTGPALTHGAAGQEGPAAGPGSARRARSPSHHQRLC